MILSVLLGLAASHGAQPPTQDAGKVDWLRKNAQVIRTINPDEEDFGDLEPIGKAIGKSRIVLLGEQSHGDGATFYAKARLIRYLHEKLGFDVLVWESGLYDCMKMGEVLRASGMPKDVANAGIFPIWSMSPAVEPVFRYALATQKTTRPLEMAGVDCQFSTANVVKTFSKEMCAFLDRANEGVNTRKLATDIDKLITALQGGYKPSAADRTKTRQFLETLKKAVAVKPTNTKVTREETAFWTRIVDNLDVFEQIQANPPMKPGDPLDDLRDHRMGDNLVWLANSRYAGKKLMVWAASFHNAFSPEQITTDNAALNYQNLHTMGTVARQKLGTDIYSIAFLAFEGKAGNPFYGAKPLTPVKPESLEALWHATGVKYAFLDMRGAKPGSLITQPNLAGPLGYSPMTAKWPLVFDGFVFTDTMFGSDSLESIPNELKVRPKDQTGPAK